MRTLDAQGKSIDEAIFNGLREMGVSIDEVEIDIIQQDTKGILGIGAKPAIVRLIEREPDQIVLPEYLTDNDRMRTGERSGPKSDGRGRSRNGGKQRGYGDERRSREERRSEPLEFKADEDECAQEKCVENEEPADVIEKKPEVIYTAEAAENNQAADFIKGLLKQMEIEGNVLANVSEEGIKIKIESESIGVLIGHRGETLDAIQYLTSLNVNRNRKENGYIRVTVDVEGYRDKREETLIRLAKKVAAQVKNTGRAKTLEPMNPYERRILHSALQDNQYVTTYSEGEEPNRRVIVAPKKREGVRKNNRRNGPRRSNKQVQAVETTDAVFAETAEMPTENAEISANESAEE